MNIALKFNGVPVSERELGSALGSLAVQALEKALRSEGFRLKKAVEKSIRSGGMEWEPISPLTRILRKRFRNRPHPGIFFAQFVRYGVGITNKGFTLKVGVFTPDSSMSGQRVKPISRSIVANARKFATGFEFAATEEYRRTRIRAFLAAKGVDDWESLSKRRKRALKRQMRKLGVFVRKGATIKAPPRPMEPFLERNRARIQRELSWLFEKALKSERWSRDWWKVWDRIEGGLK